MNKGEVLDNLTLFLSRKSNTYHSPTKNVIAATIAHILHENNGKFSVFLNLIPFSKYLDVLLSTGEDRPHKKN